MKKWLFIICCLIPFITNATPLPASQAFHLDVKKVDPNTFILDWQIKPNYFLYSDRIHLTAPKDSNAQIGTLRFPNTSTKTDKKGQIYTVYRHQLTIPVAILGNTPGETLLNLRYQGCSDDGFCYPPESKQIKLAINEQLAVSKVELDDTPETQLLDNTATDSKIGLIFSNHNWAMILLIFFGFGLLLSFTPCILPMVPVLSGIIIGHGKNITTQKAFFLSLSYVLSMSLTYALVGAIVAQLGANLQIIMQSPWAIGIFSIIFILLALSMFGFYEFKLPNSWQAKIAGTSRNQRGGHYLGAAIMGCLSTLILSPCVTAPLIGVLSYIAQTGNAWFGTLTLFFLSLGMGTPLLLIGTSAGKWLPESGGWMNAVKAFFGVLLLAVAIYLLERILPGALTMGLWGSLLIFSGIYIGGLTYAISAREKFCQGIGIILLCYGLLILIGASMGSTNPLQPLGNSEAATSNPTPLNNKKIQTAEQLNQAIEQAKDSPIMLDFYADWCASCKIMEETIFKNPEVQKTLSHFVVLKLDVTANTPENKALMNQYNVIAPPTFVFFNTKGKQLNSLKLVGEFSADEFLKTLNQIN